MKISCLGDSIRGQYTPKVIELLGKDFEVFAPNENCRFAKYTLRGMYDWREGMEGSRIVHWNNGLWDVCNLYGDGLFTSEAEYVENMLRVADILLSRHEKVIFATTTPVTKNNNYTKNEEIERYNAILVPHLQERGIIINDLYSTVAADIDRYVSNDNIHLSEEGIALCARQVADAILSAAATLADTEKTGEQKTFADASGAPVLI